jgi:ribosome-binding protein aMBF1 (putative translation factor)
METNAAGDSHNWRDFPATETNLPVPNDSFGRRVQVARLYSNLSQRQLAALIFAHRSIVSDLERGIREPKLSEILAIAKACRCPVSFLIR